MLTLNHVCCSSPTHASRHDATDRNQWILKYFRVISARIANRQAGSGRAEKGPFSLIRETLVAGHEAGSMSKDRHYLVRVAQRKARFARANRAFFAMKQVRSMVGRAQNGAHLVLPPESLAM
jgi:hypothetical protein